MTYIVDIILAAIFALIIIISAKKGFFKSLFDLIGSILAFIIAKALSASFAPVLFENVIRPGAEKYLSSSLSSAGTTDYSTQIEQALNSIPDSLGGLMQIIGINKEAIMEKFSAVDLKGENPIETIMNTVVEPIGTALIQFIMIAILALVLIVAIKIVVKLLDKIITALPVVKRFNSLFGAVFGMLRGVIVVAVFSMLISVVAGFISNEAFIESVDNSIIINIFDGVLASFSGINL